MSPGTGASWQGVWGTYRGYNPEQLQARMPVTYSKQGGAVRGNRVHAVLELACHYSSGPGWWLRCNGRRWSRRTRANICNDGQHPSASLICAGYTPVGAPGPMAPLAQAIPGAAKGAGNEVSVTEYAIGNGAVADAWPEVYPQAPQGPLDPNMVAIVDDRHSPLGIEQIGWLLQILNSL